MERRKALKNIGLSIGGMIATPSIVGLMQSCSSQETPWKPVFYTKDQSIFLKNIVNTLLPAVDDLPSAVDVNVHIFIDKYTQNVVSFEEKATHRKSMMVTINHALKLADKELVKDLRENDFENFLATHLAISKEEQDQKMKKIWSHEKENKSDLDENLIVYQQLISLKDMAIWAYKISEQVGENIMAYESIPGRQEGCVDLMETTNGRAWSVVQSV